MIYVENEGALFRGRLRDQPEEVWSEQGRAWEPYTGRVPKPMEWGTVVSGAEAKAMMGEAPTEDAAA